MKRSTKQIINGTVKVLNQINNTLPEETLNVVNDILAEIAEGNKVLAAVDGERNHVGYIAAYHLNTGDTDGE